MRGCSARSPRSEFCSKPLVMCMSGKKEGERGRRREGRKEGRRGAGIVKYRVENETARLSLLLLLLHCLLER